MSVGDNGEEGEKAMGDMDVLWEWGMGRNTLGGLRVHEDDSLLWRWYKQ